MAHDSPRLPVSDVFPSMPSHSDGHTTAGYRAEGRSSSVLISSSSYFPSFQTAAHILSIINIIITN